MEPNNWTLSGKWASSKISHSEELEFNSWVE